MASGASPRAPWPSSSWCPSSRRAWIPAIVIPTFVVGFRAYPPPLPACAQGRQRRPDVPRPVLYPPRARARRLGPPRRRRRRAVRPVVHSRAAPRRLGGHGRRRAASARRGVGGPRHPGPAAHHLVAIPGADPTGARLPRRARRRKPRRRHHRHHPRIRHTMDPTMAAQPIRHSPSKPDCSTGRTPSSPPSPCSSKTNPQNDVRFVRIAARRHHSERPADAACLPIASTYRARNRRSVWPSHRGRASPSRAPPAGPDRIIRQAGTHRTFSDGIR